jgi:Holliday junction resolvasome RuvABC ATP-dependent DNA helicase subunit
METTDYFPSVIGQEKAKNTLSFFIDGYKANSVLPHIMITAPRGCGKTWIAQALAKSLTPAGEAKPKKLITFNCSQLKNLSQFMNEIVIPHINEQDCTVFFDEASELPRDVSMALLTITNPNPDNMTQFAYEDFLVNFNFRRQSFVFATTEGQSIFHALMDRMERVDLEDYTLEELGKILLCGMEGYDVEVDALLEISKVLRGNARAGQKMAIKMKSYMDAKGLTHFQMKDWREMSKRLAIQPLGLLSKELELMRLLKRKKSTRLMELTAILQLSRGAIQRDYELYLMKQGLIEINPDGRSLTTKGHKYLEKLDGKAKPRKKKKK